MMNAILIHDANGRQVFGLDSETQLALYRRGVRTFTLPNGLTLKILCALPNAADAHSLETLDCHSATPNGEETTSRHSDTCAVD
jgi:hypothetical protein